MQASKDNTTDELMDFFATSDEILRLSLLTLVHRAILQPPGSGTTFSPSCIEAARATLHRHQECLAIIEKSRDDLLPQYVHWYALPGWSRHSEHKETDEMPGPFYLPRLFPLSSSFAG